MKTKTVMILESNIEVLEQLKESFVASKDFSVLYAGNDGSEGIRELLKIKPDLLIVSVFLQGADGCSVMQTVKRTWQGTKIIATGIGKDEVIERALSCGAASYLIKPFSVENALDLSRDILRSSLMLSESAPAARRATTIEEKISDIFISIGIPPHIKGYAYLREGIRMTVDKPQVINSVTKELYPSVAKKYQTSSSKVERAMRHAIEVAWNRGRIEAINAIFGARIYLGTEKPTNSEFIALVADKLILENLA